MFEISKIIQNFDYKYISGHVLLCTKTRHLNSNSTHCALPGSVYILLFNMNFSFNFQGPSVGAANIPNMPQTGLPYYNLEAKGQLISKGRFGVFKYTKKPTKFLVRIPALASKKRLNQKHIGPRGFTKFGIRVA